jgi:hypothetical protein
VPVTDQGIQDTGKALLSTSGQVVGNDVGHIGAGVKVDSLVFLAKALQAVGADSILTTCAD